jgi:hypothetical protein
MRRLQRYNPDMKVFLSYSAEDEAFAAELRERLSELRIKVWDPNTELRRGSNWLLTTGLALARAEAVVFIFSRSTAHSPWARREVEYAISHSKYEGKVVSVRLSPRVEIPWILETLPVVDVKRRDAKDAAKQIVRALRRGKLRALRARRLLGNRQVMAAPKSAKPATTKTS